MTLGVATVLRESLRRLATGPALLLLLALAVIQTIAALLAGPVYRVAPDAVLSGTGDPFDLALEPVPLVGLALVCVVAGYVGLVTIRVFATRWGVVEREHLTHGVASGLVNWLAGALVVAAFVAVGLAVLVVPGAFVLGALLLALPFVAVEDANAVSALARSWRATDGHRTTLLALAVAVLLIDAVLFVVSVALATALAGSLAPLGLFAGMFAVAIAFVFLWIAMARTYAGLDDTAA
ncbi:hypothetical protein [Halococcus agarilyticus]|uniref:hypothetical protein n=1 Tax=Halococcus agarilyticus TaxID=1232219 RepID=UPI000677C304|nr:hypothetical protein [Halococcus agarilyticus]